MAFLQVNFFSEVLNMPMSANVILPQGRRGCLGMYEGEEAESIPTVYLLHGMTDDQHSWIKGTAIDAEVRYFGYAIVMPTTYMGWYTDMKYGYKYCEFIGKELPEIMRSMFPALSRKRDDTFVAGNSMGGYGALKIALSYPETFVSALCLSSAFDPKWLKGEKNMRFITDIFGSLEEFDGSENDVFHLAAKIKEEGRPLPHVYMWCGVSDGLLEYSRKMYDHLKELGYDVTYSETEGSHGWICWQPQVRPMIQYIDGLIDRIGKGEA